MSKCPTYLKNSIDRLLEAHAEYVFRGCGDPDLYEYKELELEHRRALLEASIAKHRQSDLEFLIAQIDTIEHDQDRKKIAKIAKKHGIKRIWE